MTEWYGQLGRARTAIWRAAIDQRARTPCVAGANDSGSFMNQGSSMMAWEAMNKLDFWMEANLWHHPTADCADILVPVYHWLEMEFPRISQGPHSGLAMNVPCVEAPGDCKDDPMFMKAFAKAYGFPWSIDPECARPGYPRVLHADVSSGPRPLHRPERRAHALRELGRVRRRTSRRTVGFPPRRCTRRKWAPIVAGRPATWPSSPAWVVPKVWITSTFPVATRPAALAMLPPPPSTSCGPRYWSATAWATRPWTRALPTTVRSWIG